RHRSSLDWWRNRFPWRRFDLFDCNSGERSGVRRIVHVGLQEGASGHSTHTYVVRPKGGPSGGENAEHSTPNAGRPIKKRLFRESGARRRVVKRPQNRGGGTAPHSSRISATRQHSECRACPGL